MVPNRTFNQIFYPRKNNPKDTKASMYVRVTIDGVRTEISINRKINIVEWNEHSRRMTGKTPQARSFNAYLDSVEFRIFEIYKDLILHGSEVSGDIIKAKFLGIDLDKPRMLIEIFDNHNKLFLELVGKDFAIGSYKRFQVCRKALKEFLEWKFQVSDINIKKLNFEFINDFEFYLKSVRNCSHNTVMGYIKKLKKITRQCVAKDWLVKDPFMAFKITLRETHRAALTEDELLALISKEPLMPRMEQVRDIFIFSCYTGLSYSDVEKLTDADISKGIDGEKWIITTRTKTDTATRVPLLPPAISILEKYSDHPVVVTSGKLLPVNSNQKLNAFLKELAELCGIKKELTFHVARHTFATTVTLSNGVPIETVSKMLGHKSLRTTQQYAKILDRKVSDDMKSLRDKLSVQNKDTKSAD
jgi:integrase